MEAHGTAANDVQFSEDGSFVYTAGADGKVCVVDAVTGKIKGQLTMSASSGASNLMCVSQSGRLIAAGGSDKSVRLMDLRMQKLRRTFTEHRGTINSALFANKGRVLVTAGTDRCIKLWDTVQARCVRTINTPSIVNRASLSSDGHFAASAHQDGTARLWDLRSGKLMAESADGLHVGAVTSVCFSRGDGSSRVLTASRDGVLRFLDGRTLEAVRVPRAGAGAGSGEHMQRTRSGNGAPSSGSFSGGASAATRGGGLSPSSTASSDADAAQLELRRPGFEIPFNWCKASLSGGGKHALAACGGRRGEVVVWSAIDGRERAVLGPGTKAPASMLARTMQMFGSAPGAESTGGAEGHSSRVIAVAWAPDGRRMASSDEDGSLVLWG